MASSDDYAGPGVPTFGNPPAPSPRERVVAALLEVGLGDDRYLHSTDRRARAERVADQIIATLAGKGEET